MRNDLLKQIRSCRKKLDATVKKTGINSPETRKISDKMDKLINEYYASIEIVNFPNTSSMQSYYETSYSVLKRITKEFNKFPTVQEWNNYAKENNCLSSMSMEYITKMDWNYLRVKILRELNIKI